MRLLVAEDDLSLSRGIAMVLKKNPIPVLILSAKSEIEDKVNGLNAGANDYLVHKNRI